MIKVAQPDALKYLKTIEAELYIVLERTCKERSIRKSKYQIEVWYYKHSYITMAVESANVWDSSIFLS